MKVEASSVAKSTTNPIRNIVDRSKVTPNPDKEIVSLSLGDPTVFGNLKTADEVVKTMKTVLEGHKANGYAPVTGTKEAKEAIAKRYRTRFSTEFTAEVNKTIQLELFLHFVGHCYCFRVFGCIGYGHFSTLHTGRIGYSNTFTRFYTLWNILWLKVHSKHQISAPS